jgi:mRNA interferase RelE/StbE
VKVIIQPNAKKDLKGLSKDVVGKILKKLHSILEDPLRHIERLKSAHLWKLRTGDHRAILFVDTKNEKIHVLKVGHRKNIYKRLSIYLIA